MRKCDQGQAAYGYNRHAQTAYTLKSGNLLHKYVETRKQALGSSNFGFFYSFSVWASPGGTAIPGQPVARMEQAPSLSPGSKNQINIDVSQWETYQILS